MPTAYHVFMLLKATPAWLRLAPAQRFAFLRETIEPILERHEAVTLRFFGSEFFNARVSDMAMWETRDLDAYRALVEALRETPFWGTHFEVGDIVPSVENAYARHYGEAPVAAR